MTSRNAEKKSEDVPRSRRLHQVLTIAGSDPGSGAGIQADLKAIEANGAYALTVITSITAQNTQGVNLAFDLPLRVIEAQMAAVYDDFSISAAKTGMLASKVIVRRIARLLQRFGTHPLVVDPVLVSKSGYPLLKPDAISMLKSELIPRADLVTPNIPEAEILSGMKIDDLAEAEQAARKIHALGCGAVLIKGGHFTKRQGLDLLFDGAGITLFPGEFISTPHTHGTGCTYAAAIAARLARKIPLQESVQQAKRYVVEAIRHAHAMGHGHGPINHFYFIDRERVP